MAGTRAGRARAASTSIADPSTPSGRATSLAWTRDPRARLGLLRRRQVDAAAVFLRSARRRVPFAMYFGSRDHFTSSCRPGRPTSRYRRGRSSTAVQSTLFRRGATGSPFAIATFQLPGRRRRSGRARRGIPLFDIAVARAQAGNHHEASACACATPRKPLDRAAGRGRNERIRVKGVEISICRSSTISFGPSLERGVYVNDVTSHEEDAAYTSPSSLEATPIVLEGATVRAALAPNRVRVPRKRTQLSPSSTRSSGRAHLAQAGCSPPTSPTSSQIRMTSTRLRLQGDPATVSIYVLAGPVLHAVRSRSKANARSSRIRSLRPRLARRFRPARRITIKRVPGGLVSL